MPQAYERLAALYDQEWGKFSATYLTFIDQAQKRYDFQPQSALDLACGTGNLVSALVERKMHVVGVDSSEAMIRTAQTKYPHCRFLQRSMVNFSIGEKFDLVTCAFDSINYLLEPAQIVSMFASVHAHLQPHGMFLFDANTPLLYEHKHHGTLDRTIDGERVQQILSYEQPTRLATTTFVFSDEVQEIHTQRGYTSQDILPLIAENDLQVLATWDTTEGTNATSQSERIFYVVTLL